MPATAVTEKLDPDDLRSRQRFTRPVCTTPEEMSDDGAEGSNKRTFRKYLNHGIGLDKLLDYSHQGIKDLFRGACRTGPGRVGPRSGNEHAALRSNVFDDKKQQLTHAEDPDAAGSQSLISSCSLISLCYVVSFRMAGCRAG